MRGSPLLQALILLLALISLGVAGHRFIQMEPSRTSAAASETTSPEPSETQVEAEIELTFSTPPISYQLKRPSTQGSDEIAVLTNPQTSQAIENPAYADAVIPSHQLTTYWLDVVWAKTPPENSRHFVTINLSPSNGQSQRFSFSSDSAEMNETFDYSPARHE